MKKIIYLLIILFGASYFGFAQKSHSGSLTPGFYQNEYSGSIQPQFNFNQKLSRAYELNLGLGSRHTIFEHKGKLNTNGIFFLKNPYLERFDLSLLAAKQFNHKLKIGLGHLIRYSTESKGTFNRIVQ